MGGGSRVLNDVLCWLVPVQPYVHDNSSLHLCVSLGLTKRESVCFSACAVHHCGYCLYHLFCVAVFRIGEHTYDTPGSTH